MYTECNENLSPDHWVFPVDAREFHKAAGIKTSFTTWMRHNIRLHRMREGNDYFSTSEWSSTANRIRDDFELQYWFAKKIADNMTPEKKEAALDFLSNIRKIATERNWHLYT
jgi:phage anti-repressor protein